MGRMGVTPLQRGGERVGVDGSKIVDVDHRPNRFPGGTPAPPEARGREAPSFFFFLGLLPKWEKDFPSSPWLPWHGSGESPSEIGSPSPISCVSRSLDLA